MSSIWEDMGVWVDRVGEATLAAVDTVGNQSLIWLDEALAGHSPDEALAFIAELDRNSWISLMMRESRVRKTQVQAQYGDVIGVQRFGYTHFGIYVSDEEVIHYCGSGDDIAMDAVVRATDLTTFLRGDTEYFVLDLQERELDNLESMLGLTKAFHQFSPDETVRRARRRLGENRYNLLANNCEHFALWCKTGNGASAQVESLIDAIGRLSRPRTGNTFS